AATDQQTAASFWSSDISANIPDHTDLFSSTHGVVQTHPSLGASRGVGGQKTSSSTYRHLDYRSSSTAELRNNPSLSHPNECARACREGEPPKICYYHFTLEFYTVLGA
ncbi:unnamed protein product, partial [Callosobruchus maculatus]